MKEEKDMAEGDTDEIVDLTDTFKRAAINSTAVARVSAWKGGLAFRRTRWSHDKDTVDQIGPGERCMWRFTNRSLTDEQRSRVPDLSEPNGADSIRRIERASLCRDPLSIRPLPSFPSPNETCKTQAPFVEAPLHPCSRTADRSLLEGRPSLRLCPAIQLPQDTTAKTSIATVCLVYSLYLDLDLPTKKHKKTFPLAQYCAKYWIIFAAIVESKDEILQDFIKEFFYYHRSSYRNCYSFYCPDRSWKDEPAEGGEEPASLLYYISFGGLTNAVKCFLSQGIDINVQDGEYGNTLQAVSVEDHEKMVEQLFGADADVNAQGGEYGNTLQAASVEGHEKMVEQLFGAGADINMQGGEYGNTLQAASVEGHEKVVEQLFSAGVMLQCTS